MTIPYRLLLAASIACMGALQFGYHLAELNAPSEVISCVLHPPEEWDQIDCIPMTSRDIGLVTSIYSVGGFISASFAGPLADRFGRKGLSLLNCILFVLGPIIMAGSSSVSSLSVGRFVSGLGAGSGIVVTPLYLNEISPPALRGTLGSMNQFSVNIGILLAQVLGLFLSTDYQWRYILSAGAIIGVANALMLSFCTESPKWFAFKGKTAKARSALAYLRGHNDIEDEISQWTKQDENARENEQAASISTDNEEAERLLDPTQSTLSSSTNEAQVFPGSRTITFKQFCTLPFFRRQAIAVVGIMSSQQLSGINSIIFYGVSILSATLPQYSSLINCGISVINCVVTASVSPFVDKYGRKPLLQLSMSGMIITSAFLAIGIIHDLPIISSASATAFVISYAMGLGPIPFLIIPELVSEDVAGVAQSLGTTANWVMTFLVGFLFPIIHSKIHGYTFLIFTVIGAMCLTFTTMFVPETKGKTLDQIWRK